MNGGRVVATMAKTTSMPSPYWAFMSMPKKMNAAMRAMPKASPTMPAAIMCSNEKIVTDS
jgi:hypothetical protein